ncbi:MAG TPA: hypothetical protein VM282_20575 [Acidimicrobiales bacterium]|nr:hypothetical protein [Acidimicrobiales bacterium]
MRDRCNPTGNFGDASLRAYWGRRRNALGSGLAPQVGTIHLAVEFAKRLA